MTNMTPHQLLRWAQSKIAKHITSEVYGTLTFKFEKGVIVMVRSEVTEKPSLDDLK